MNRNGIGRQGDIAMPYCPECGAEYRKGYEECTDCGVELVEDEDELFPDDEEAAGDEDEEIPEVIPIWWRSSAVPLRGEPAGERAAQAVRRRYGSERFGQRTDRTDGEFCLRDRERLQSARRSDPAVHGACGGRRPGGPRRGFRGRGSRLKRFGPATVPEIVLRGYGCGARRSWGGARPMSARFDASVFQGYRGSLRRVEEE